MEDNLVSDVVLLVLGLLLVLDLVIRIVDIRSGRLEVGLRNRIGVLPLPVLACTAVVTTLFIGWLGWVLGIVAGLAAVSNLRMTNMPEAPWEHTLLHGTLVFAHMLVTALCLRALFIDGFSVFGTLFGVLF